jgi:SAM-dependent methyltransferase
VREIGPRCPACGGEGGELFHEQSAVPVNSCLLLRDRDEAVSFPRGDIRLARCPGCGFVFNAAFDAARAEYSARYEETQACSARFVEFARDLARQWVDDHDLRGGTVLEIGCGKGEFLTMMVDAGVGKAIGVDPGVDTGRIADLYADRITWIPDFYSERYADLPADAIVCRHTLEHIAPVGDFMRTIRRAVGDRDDTVLLFEVPDVERVLDEVAFWDVYYEHCSYFSARSLARLFALTGFDVMNVERVFDDQYLVIEARPAAVTTPDSDDADALRRATDRFAERFRERIEHWRRRLVVSGRDGGRPVVWGAGSKAVAFLSAVGNGVEYAVDVNPRKHGTYLAGTGQRVVPPSFLTSYRPDLVIAMNPAYRAEIARDIDGLGLDAELVTV